MNLVESWMNECFRLAKKGEGFVSPNPLVGAVLVNHNQIVARGYHKRFGGPHAEVECLRRFHGDLKSATLFVNLEPCSHYGKTPPCTDLIIQSGVRRVVAAIKDPNPIIAGNGIRKLRRAGIQVTVGTLEDQARQLNRKYIKYITTGLPFVHLKIAQTLDGKIASFGGNSDWISSSDSRKLVHRWRAEHDAVMVGAATVRIDDPALTVRLIKGRNPNVVILDGKFSTPANARVLRRTGNRQVFLCVGKKAAKVKKRKARLLESRRVRILPLPDKNGLLSLKEVLRTLSRLNIGSILVEGGSQVFIQFLYQGLVDQLSVFVAPTLMGSGVAAFRSTFERHPSNGYHRINNLISHRVGRDVLVQGYFE
jgi:diaminohydroxyphosphoribosylaminopyrimidine deaminase/5-amino-6-(5-phosphoribosylamino)uracil reductase